MNTVFCYILTAAAAYLLGSVSFGIIIAKLAKGPDLHTVGSKNTGASNVLRTMGWKYGLLTFVGDFVKALLACWIGKLLVGHQYGGLFAGLFVILGHNWPVFFGFRGGKGVASSCGVMVYCFPIPALICFVVAVSIIASTKYISLGSMSMLILYFLLVSVFYSHGSIIIILWAASLAALCLIRHISNIRRLIAGTENRIGQRIS